jgi:phosphatidylglycerol:prolipoprotein diacylglycerol transferase
MINPIALEIGPFIIRWYGITAALGVVFGYVYFRAISRKLSINSSIIERIFPLLVFFGLIGARAYHVANEPAFYLAHPLLIPAIWHGGLAIHGAVIVGALTLWYFAKKYKIEFFKLADCLFPSLMLGQAIGRWGNFFNQELFGAPTSLPWGIFIEQANRPLGFEQFTHFHPAFLYEFIWNLIIVALITLWVTKKPPQKNGIIFGASLALWGLGRFLVELIRIDPAPIIFGSRLPLAVSIAIIILGIAIFKKAQSANRQSFSNS